MAKGWELASSGAQLAKGERTGLGCAAKGLRAELWMELPSLGPDLLVGQAWGSQSSVPGKASPFPNRKPPQSLLRIPFSCLLSLGTLDYPELLIPLFLS